MAKRKTFYITKRKVNKFVDTHIKEVKTYSTFLTACQGVLKDLKESPKDKKTQIRFFNKVEKLVTTRAIIEQLPK
jgi:hypothetical protein